MRIAVLGTGSAGTALGTGFARLGHDVRLGSRTADNPKALAWAAEVGGTAATGTFRDVCAWAEVVGQRHERRRRASRCSPRSATPWPARSSSTSRTPSTSLRASRRGCRWCNDDSLGEQIQRALPETFVVKSLNTLNGDVMLNPGAARGALRRLPGR